MRCPAGAASRQVKQIAHGRIFRDGMLDEETDQRSISKPEISAEKAEISGLLMLR